MSPATAMPLPMPLSGEQHQLLARFADAANNEALLWASGYLAGVAHPRTPATLAPAPQAAAQQATIVFGSQTGNARRAAEALHVRLQADGLPVRLLRADAYPLRELANESLLYVVISTQGDGEPPDDARGLLEFLEGRRAPKLPQLKYSVLALGDSSYPLFCAIGKRIDERLQALGGERIADCAQADLDIETIAAPWTDTVAKLSRGLLQPAAPSATVTPLRPLQAAAARHSRAAPFSASVLGNQRITFGVHSKDVRHIELSLQDAGLAYEPGDALGLWPRNPDALVDAVLQATALDGGTEVTITGDTLPLRAWLSDKRELTRLARPFLSTLAERSGDPDLRRLLQPEQASALSALLSSQQVIDLLLRHRVDWNAQALVTALRPLQPRLYSIASSRKEVGDEAHLTVAHVEYGTDHGMRWGAASHQLATAGEGDTLPVYIEANERFRLPADPARDVVMIGAGTGVAPFRGFLQERRAIAATGRNWLFFGNPHFRSDFLYQLEWQRALKDGQLHRLDLAFSRDGASKTYVQHRIAEHADALLGWLRDGAHVYVCGAIAMGKDVHAALLEAATRHHDGDREAATHFLDALARDGRYARDVY